jgi:DNA-binding NtrC family response regulator
MHESGGSCDRMIGDSFAFRAVRALIHRFANCNAPVLISGATGTGKELAARALHYGSDRRPGPFVPVDCAALPDTLVVNELFGHAKGAYTGAHEAQEGLVLQATGGTLFLDEVDSLDLPSQAGLLRFLQDQEFRPLGGGRPRRADVRILAASNVCLEDLIDKRQFRGDLYFRLNVLRIAMPSLSERREDIAAMATSYLDQLAAQYEQAPKTLAPDALVAAEQYDWPGNIRELQNRLHRAFVLAGGLVIFAADLDLPPEGAHANGSAAAAVSMANGSSSNGSSKKEPSPLDGSFAQAKARAIERFEQAYLNRLMEATEGNVSAASRVAGKERRALGKLLKKHGIDRRFFRPSP